MARVKGRDNVAEVSLRRALWNAGLRFRLHVGTLPGRPDIVFAGARIVVFVDGDFWHGRVLLEKGTDALKATFRGPRPEWWIAKIQRTAERDRLVTRQLEEAGWDVLRFWEKEVQRDLRGPVTTIVQRVRRGRAAPRRKT